MNAITIFHSVIELVPTPSDRDAIRQYLLEGIEPALQKPPYPFRYIYKRAEGFVAAYYDTGGNFVEIYIETKKYRLTEMFTILFPTDEPEIS